jgi:hypothetical protein
MYEAPLVFLPPHILRSDMPLVGILVVVVVVG